MQLIANSQSVRFVVFCAAACLVGCGGSTHHATVRVSGRVTYNGALVPGAMVNFFREGETAATATTDAEGRYTLRTYDGVEGAFPGLNKIAVTKREKVVDPAKPDDPYPQFRDLLPAKYGMVETSQLTHEIVAGKANDVPLELRD